MTKASRAKTILSVHVLHQIYKYVEATLDEALVDEVQMVRGTLESLQDQSSGVVVDFHGNGRISVMGNVDRLAELEKTLQAFVDEHDRQNAYAEKADDVDEVHRPKAAKSHGEMETTAKTTREETAKLNLTAAKSDAALHIFSSKHDVTAAALDILASRSGLAYEPWLAKLDELAPDLQERAAAVDAIDPSTGDG